MTLCEGIHYRRDDWIEFFYVFGRVVKPSVVNGPVLGAVAFCGDVGALVRTGGGPARATPLPLRAGERTPSTRVFPMDIVTVSCVPCYCKCPRNRLRSHHFSPVRRSENA